MACTLQFQQLPIKRLILRKEEDNPQLHFSSIFPDSPLKTSTKPLLEAQLKMQRSPYQRLKLALRLENEKRRLEEGQAVISSIRWWLGFLLIWLLLELWVAKSLEILGWDVGFEPWYLSWMFRNDDCGYLVMNERLFWLLSFQPNSFYDLN